MENVSNLYQKLIYRDILGYTIPGSIFIGALWAVVTPIKVGAYELKPPQSISAGELIVVAALGFIAAHLLAFFPRRYLDTKNERIKSANKAFKHDQVEILSVWLQNAVNKFFDNSLSTKFAWEKLELFEKREYIKRWISAFDLKTDQYHRIFAIRLFCENAMFILPLAMFILAIRIDLANLSRGLSALLLIGGGALLGLLAFLGWREVREHEDREAIFIFVSHYVRELRAQQSHSSSGIERLDENGSLIPSGYVNKIQTSTHKDA